MTAASLLALQASPALRQAALLVLLALLAVVVVAALAFIFARREPWELEEAPERVRSLERAYERALRTLKDLEFDQQAGTLSGAEHAELRREYKAEAVSVRRALDAARQAMVRQVAQGRKGSLSSEEKRRIEALVARVREGRGEAGAR